MTILIPSTTDPVGGAGEAQSVWRTMFHPPVNVLGLDTYAGIGGSNDWSALYSASPAVGNYIEWDAYMQDGTWAATYVGTGGGDAAIMTLKLDGTTVCTFDLYAASASLRRTVTGLTVASAGVKRVRLEVTAKNASSSNYYERFYALAMQRTG